MKSVLSLLAVAAASLALPTSAQEASTAEAQREPAQQTKPAEKICRNVALNPDSRRKERLCLTQAEWRELNNPR